MPDLRLALYQHPKSPPGIPAGDEPSPIPEMHHVAAPAVRLQRGDRQGVDQGGSPDSDEAVPQASRHSGQRLPEEMLLAPLM